MVLILFAFHKHQKNALSQQEAANTISNHSGTLQESQTTSSRDVERNCSKHNFTRTYSINRSHGARVEHKKAQRVIKCCLIYGNARNHNSILCYTKNLKESYQFNKEKHPKKVHVQAGSTRYPFKQRIYSYHLALMI